MSKNVKKRTWAFVLYPDSAPPDWRDRLSLSGLSCAVSPLHDRDLNADGLPKKPHYHVIVVYQGPTTFSSVSVFTSSLCATIPQPLESVRGYYRYLTHKDNPEKVQYDEKDILHFGGFCLSDFCELSKSEVSHALRDIQQFCRDNGIVEYAQLCDVLADAPDLFEWYQLAVTHTIFFSTYLKSARFMMRGVPAVLPSQMEEGKPVL